MRYRGGVRTTLSIDDDVLQAARAMASRQRRSVGEIISELARKSLREPKQPLKTRNGVPLLPVRDPHVTITLELVNRLRDEEP